MSCLKQIICGDRVIIGIRDFDKCLNPESDLFINDLPGISLKTAANITPEQWQSGVEFLQNSIRMAIKHVFDEFSAELAPYFDFNLIIESRVIDKFNDEVIPAAALERGLVIKRWRSEMARIFIKQVFVKVAQAGPTVIKVVDGATTTDFPVDLVAGVNAVQLDYKAEAEEVKILFDQTNFDVYSCQIKGVSNSCGSCGGGHSNKHAFVTGWNGTAEENNCFGIGIESHIRCYEENVLCILIPRMSFLIWYKAGMVVLSEFINSNRINHIATFGKDQAKELLAEYTTKYDEKYKMLVKNSYNFLKTTKGECITCNGNVYVQNTP